MNSSKFASQWMQSISFVLAAKAAQLIKVSFVLGSYGMFFSLSNCITPLAGAFAGLNGASLAMGIKIVITMLFTGKAISLSYLADCLPGLFAGYYWASRSALIRVIAPLVCMALFIAHPAGAIAWSYTLYWWVPIILFFARTKSLFGQALGSTFVAHAVGSVIWLYTVPSMTPAMWHALIPIVAIERLLFALGMVIAYRFYAQLLKVVSRFLVLKTA